MPEEIHVNIHESVPDPDPKTSGRRHIGNDMSDEDFNRMFELTIGQHCLIQDNMEHGLEAARVWG